MEELQTESDVACAQPTLYYAMLEVIKFAPDSTKAKMWVALNNHNWPEELLHLKPPSLDAMGEGARQAITWRLMNEIMDAIGAKECLREWNKDTLPGMHFDDWWNKRLRCEPTEKAKA